MYYAKKLDRIEACRLQLKTVTRALLQGRKRSIPIIDLTYKIFIENIVTMKEMSRVTGNSLHHKENTREVGEKAR